MISCGICVSIIGLWFAGTLEKFLPTKHCFADPCTFHQFLCLKVGILRMEICRKVKSTWKIWGCNNNEFKRCFYQFFWVWTVEKEDKLLIVQNRVSFLSLVLKLLKNYRRRLWMIPKSTLDLGTILKPMSSQEDERKDKCCQVHSKYF